MLEFSARWTFLFFVLDEPYLTIFGIFSIPLSISFFQALNLLFLNPFLNLSSL